MERWSDGSPASTLGKAIKLRFDYPIVQYLEVTPIMEIRAPRGIMLLFGYRYGYTNYIEWKSINQCEAIKAFMEEHSYD